MPTLAIALLLASCGAGDRPVIAPPPPDERSTEQAEPGGGPIVAVPGGVCEWIVPRPEPLGLVEVSAIDAAQVTARAADGRSYRLLRDRWEVVESPNTRRARAGAPANEPPIPEGSPVVPVRTARGSDGTIVVVGAAGEIAVWRARRERTVEFDSNGAHGWRVEPGSPGWRRAEGTAPPDVVALVAVPGGVLVAGRAGELVSVHARPMLDDERVQPIVLPDARRVLRLAALRDGSVLVVRHDALLRVAPGGGAPRRLQLSGVDLEWVQRLDPRGAAPLLVTPVGTDGALVVQRSEARLITGDTLRAIDLSQFGGAPINETMGLASGGGTRWVAVTLNGFVIAADGASWRVIGRVQELDGPNTPTPVAFPLGAFTGTDGRVRIADRHRPLGCVDLAEASPRIAPCGPTPAVDERAIQTLSGGLMIDTQQMEAAIVSETGARRIPIVHGGSGLVAGRASTPVAIPDRGRELNRLDGNAWRSLVRMPEGLTPSALGIQEGPPMIALVGGADGSVAACRLP